MTRGEADIRSMELFEAIYKLDPVVKAMERKPGGKKVKKAQEYLKDAYNILGSLEFVDKGRTAAHIKKIDESAKREKPRTGEIWQHFKGGRYAIICVAVNATNGDDGKYVVYKKIGADEWYVRDLYEFMSAVDAKKYPDATQKWRFEKTLSDYSCWSTGGVGVLNDTDNPD